MDQGDKEKVKAGAWGSVVGAIITIIIGFAWGGWVLSSSSRNMGEDMAETAVIERLITICVGQFNQDPQRDEKLKILKGKNSWDSATYVKAQGWATMPSEKEPNSRVVDGCSALLMKNS